ncbi:hypothetical protein NBRC116494_29230 [Aurantivibrio plasticivorans]
MTSQIESASAPILDAQLSEPTPDKDEQKTFETFWRSLRARQDTLLLIRQLTQMVTAVQLHRGMSMSLLAGSEYFGEEIEQLQSQLRHQLTALEVFVEETGELLSDRDKECLHQAWRTITHDWRDDDVLDNFELHSHFVEELLNMISRLSDELKLPLSDQLISEQEHESTVTYPHSFKQLELLNFVAQQLPKVIEQLAKIRGLSSHAASIGRVEYQLDRKLRYLIESVRIQNEKLRHQSSRLETIINEEYRSLSDVKLFEIKLIFLFGRLEDELLGGQGADVDGPQLFKLCTEVINIYSKIADEGWQLVRRWIDYDAERWIHLQSTAASS